MRIESLFRSGPARLLFGICLAALVVSILYLYEQGLWMDVIRFCRHFFQPRRLQAYVASFGPFAWIVFILLQALQVVAAPVPGEVTGFIGGLLFGTVLGSLLSTVGLVLGSVIAFALARVFGARLVRKIVSEEFRERFESFTSSNKGFACTFLFFLLPGVPKDTACYLLGLGGMAYSDFLLMNIFARLPGTVALTLQGSAVRHGKYGMFLILLLVTAALLAVMYPLRKFFLKSFRTGRAQNPGAIPAAADGQGPEAAEGEQGDRSVCAFPKRKSSSSSSR